MRLIYGLIISILLLFILINSYRKTKDIFSPLSIFSVLQFLKYVPHLISTEYESKVYLDANNLFYTFLVEMIFIISIYIGYSIVKVNSKVSKEKRIIDIPIYIILSVYLIGFASRVYILNQLGGISYIIQNMGRAYHELMEVGSGYISNLGYLMTIAIIMCIYKYSNIKKTSYMILTILLTIIGMSTYLIYSSRSPALEMLMVVVLSYHYFVKKISLKSLLKPSVLFIVFLVLAIIIVLPSIRGETLGNSTIDYNTFKFNISIANIFREIGNEFSVVGRDTYVYNHFNIDNYWFGANYANLFVALIPSSIYVNKPCLDDGNYLCNLIYGYECNPNDGRNDLPVKYSMPFSSQSIAYANFGYLGVILGGIFLGALYKNVYNKMKNNPTVFTVILYQLIVYQFELTTLGIMQAIVPLVLCFVVYYFSEKFSNYYLKCADYSKC